MGSGLLCNQNGKLVCDVIYPRHPVCRGVGADGKFPHGKGLMVEKKIVLDILAVLLFGLKIRTGISADPPVLKINSRFS